MTTETPAMRSIAQLCYQCVLYARAVRCQAVAAPPAPAPPAIRKTVKDVSAVALKDAPLKSLYPDEPGAPKPVSVMAPKP